MTNLTQQKCNSPGGLEISKDHPALLVQLLGRTATRTSRLVNFFNFYYATPYYIPLFYPKSTAGCPHRLGRNPTGLAGLNRVLAWIFEER